MPEPRCAERVKEIVVTRRFERDFRRLKRELPRQALDYETLEYAFGPLQTAKPLPDGAVRPGVDNSSCPSLSATLE
jgi:hypothetical protein